MILGIHTPNCRFCWEQEMGTILANSSLPVGKKIFSSDYHTFDGRTRHILRAKEVFLPMTLSYEKTNEKFNSFKSKFIVISVLDFYHTKTFLKELNNIL
jgi:hypothetical protein